MARGQRTCGPHAEDRQNSILYSQNPVMNGKNTRRHRENTIPGKKFVFFVPCGRTMRPDYSHKIFGDKRLQLFLRLETCICVRPEARVRPDGYTHG
jgi:hypothetical protein